MTSIQISFITDTTLAKFDFQDWDACHQLSSLYADYEAGDITKEQLQDDVDEILKDAEVGDHLEQNIYEAIVNAILEGTDE